MSDIMRFSRDISPLAGSFDVNDRLRPASVLDIFQDAAARHAEILGCGYLTMLNKNRLWVLLRNHYEVVKYPYYTQEFVVSTWPKQGRLDFDRSYLLCDKNGEVLIKGVSKWCVIDAVSRRLVKDTRVEYPGSCPQELACLPAVKLAVPQEGQSCGMFTAGLSDLDHNGHMNNTRYADILQNCLEKDEGITELDFNYLHEMSLGDCLEVYKKREGDKLYVWGVRETVACFVAAATVSKTLNSYK